MRWTSNAGGYGDRGFATALQPELDGSATVLLRSSSYYSMVARLDANGEVVWRRSLSGSTLKHVSPSRLAIAGCNRLTILDASTMTI